MGRRLHWLVAATAAAAALSGCGGGTGAAHPTGSAPDEPTTAAKSASHAAATAADTSSTRARSAGPVSKDTACSLVTDQDVKAAIGLAPVKHSPDLHPERGRSRCTWYDKPGKDHRIIAEISVVGPPATDAEATFKKTRTSSGVEMPPPKIGDRAFWAGYDSFTSHRLVVMDNGTYLDIALGNLFETDIPTQDETDTALKRTLKLGRVAVKAHA